MKVRDALVVSGVALTTLFACGDDEQPELPAAVAPPSRHGAMRDALAQASKTYGFEAGDWQEDLGDAPFWGVAWLSHRAAEGALDADALAQRDAAVVRARALFAESLVEGDLQDKVMAALGVIEHIGASGDRAELAALDEFVDRLDTLTRTFGDYLEAGADRSWALTVYGPTSVTALIALVEAQYALLVGGPRGQERLDRALAIDAKIRERAFGDLVDAYTGKPARAYAFAPGRAGLFLYPNVAMIMLKARLFRLTKREEFRLEARAIFGAIQALKLSDAPARYASPYAAESLGAKTREVSTLSSQNYLALAMLLLFEITGEARFAEEADRVLDGIEALKGTWCRSHVHEGTSCAPACSGGQACVGGACAPDRCEEGILHHVVDGRLASPDDEVLFCSGCNLQTLYVLGQRRALAGEPY